MEFLGTWEQIYSPAFKVVEFDRFKSEADLHTFVLSAPEWIEKTEAIGLFVKRGKFGMAGICRKSGYFECCIVWFYCKSMEK